MSCNLHSFISIGVCFLYFGVFCACSAEKKIRALLVTVDNRELIEDLNTTNYVTLSAVINMQYAKRHSYEYLFISGSMNYYLSKSNNISHVKKQINSSLLTDDNYEDSSSLLTEIISKYSISRVDLPLLLSGEDRRDSKLRVSAFNINLKQFRAAPWSKLLAVWNLLQQPEISDRYDYIFYLDSDSVLSPVSSHRSLDDFFRDADTPGSIEYGPVPSKASILFFSNFPFPSYPCSGIILFSLRQPFTGMLVKEWWNQNWLRFNFHHDFEQSVLRKMIYEGHMIIAHMSFLKERQFSVEVPDQWLLHYGSHHERLVALGELVVGKHMHLDKVSFAAAVQEIKSKHSMQVDLLQIAEDISRVTYKHLTKKIHEKRSNPVLVKTKDRVDIFQIQHNMKRLVNTTAFEHWKFKMENVVVISEEALNRYTLGPPVIITTEMYASI